MAIAMAVLIAGLIAVGLVLNLTIPAAAPADDKTNLMGVATGLPFLAMTVIAVVLVARRPTNPVGWLLGALAIINLIQGIGTSYVTHWLYAQDVPRAFVVPLALAAGAANATTALSLIYLFLVFPDGHTLSPRWRILARINLALVVPGLIAVLLDPAVISDGHRQVTNPFGLGGTHSVMTRIAGAYNGLGGILLLLGVVSLVLRYRHGDSEQRQQLKWFIAGVGLFVFGLLAGGITAWPPPMVVAANVGLAALPVSIGIAVLKYRLYDIDVVINRTLVYGALALFITAIYVAIVVGIGALIGSGGRPNLALSIVATAIVAVAFQPVRERIQKVANRLVYGKRATPYEVLSQFSERVAESYAADDVLPRMARVLADGTGAVRSDVWLRSGDLLRQASSWPQDSDPTEPARIVGGALPDVPGAARVVEVRHQGELLGALTVTKRQGESLTPVEEKLLDDLASQAGLVLKNVGLTAELMQRLEELRASRQRLVAAQDEERRKLERNLHDGAQQNLVALKVKLGLAEAFAEKDPAKTTELLGQLKADADQALGTLRDLARGIYPPLLADKGLAAALEAQARKATLPVEISAEAVGRYPQETEAAIYFCVLEALQNVQKYAEATRATVHLAQAGGVLAVAVEDDGRGFDPRATKKGSGLQNMEDRLDALGGTVEIESAPGSGATVTVRLPIGEAVPA